ncbi:MAG: outer membrane lipoprotein-sorting protein [Pseudomonadales bacterium]|nr:outer membrane lipoprotein-sorting protein [Pseudomonadales bacterium]
MFKLSLALFLCFSSYVCADQEAHELLKKMDELYRSDNSTSMMTMQIVTPNWQRTLQMKSWTRGMDDTFIRVLSPAKDRGVATLKIDRDMWNYLPKINKVIKVPPSMMMGSWMGSDFSNDDLVREVSLVKEYTVKKTDEDKSWRLILTPKKETVTVWARIEIVIEKKRLLPIEQIYFNEKGEQVRTMTFSDIKKFGDRTLPATMTMQPLNKTGHKTIITYETAQFNTVIKDNIFTLRHLQKRF